MCAMNGGPLQGKVALVTGAASQIGLGHAMALALVRAGARVAMMDIDADTLAKSVTEAREAGGPDSAHALVGDTRSPDAAAAAVNRTVRELGGLHILINNAGINPRNPMGTAFWQIETDDWLRTITTNLTGSFFMARAAAGHLRAQGWGRIIGVTTSFDTMVRAAPYGPSKAGHEALIAIMAHDLEGSGVTANVLVPGGATRTNMTSGMHDQPGMLDPEVMQAPVVWLASEASSGFSGQRIIGKFWDERLPIEQRLAKAAAPAAWPDLARQATASRG